MKAETQSHGSLRREARALVDACPAWNTRLAARRISMFIDRELAGLGLTAAQAGLMAQIATIGDDTLGALAQRTGLEQSTLSRNLRTLERGGLIEIAVVETDLRRRAVWLTEAGVRRLQEALPIWSKAQATLAQILPPGLPRDLADHSEVLNEAKPEPRLP